MLFVNYIYPVLFKLNPNGGYIVTAPDVLGCVVGGNSLEESMRLIKNALCDCLCVLEDEKEKLCERTEPSKIKTEKDEFIAMIEVDTVKYRAEIDNKSVRKNVSLPAWLNTKAEQNHINCSQILQEALRERLKV